MSVALALAAAGCFGAQTLLIQRGLASDDEASALGAATFTLVASTGVLWALVAVRRGVPTFPAAPVAALFAVAGAVDPGAARLCYFEGIDRIGPSVSAAITAASPAVAAVVAVVALGSSLGVVDVVGLGLVVLGVSVLHLVRPSRSAAGDVELRTDVVRRELVDAAPRDSLYPLAATVCIAVAFVVVKVGLDAFPDTLTATAVTQTAALVTLAVGTATSARARTSLRSPPRPAVGAFALAGVVVAVGWYAMFLALERGTVVAVLPVVSTYPLVVVAARCVEERALPRSPVLVGAVVAIVIGVAAVQAG